MPVMDGIEAVCRFRKVEAERGVGYPLARQLIIGCSANSDSDTHTAALQSGMDAFLGKPMTHSSFQEIYNKLK